MSSFMPEGGKSGSPFGSSGLTPASTTVTEEDIALMQRVLGAAASRPSSMPEQFMAYLLDYIATSNLVLPIGQIFGSKNQVNSTVATALAGMFKARFANSEAEVAITSTTFATFAGAPSITGLDNGTYVVLWGASAKGDDLATGSSLFIAARPNGAGNTNYAESQEQSYYTSIARGDTVTLSAGNGLNSLALVASTQIAGHTSKARFTWLMCLKTAN